MDKESLRRDCRNALNLVRYAKNHKEPYLEVNADMLYRIASFLILNLDKETINIE